MTFPTNLRLIYIRDLLRELVVRDIKLRYQRSLLGIAWSLINPLCQILIFTFLFNRVVPLNIPNYTVFVFCGVLAWSWFQSSLYMAAGSIVDNRDLIRRPGFPVAVLPAVTVATNMIHFLIAFPVLLIFLLLDGSRLAPSVSLLPLVVLMQFVLTLGLVYLISALQVTFRDIQHLLSIILMLLFYLTPIFYHPDAVPDQYQFFYQLNPMAHLMTIYRTMLINGAWPDLGSLAFVSGVSILLFALGYTVFQRASAWFVEEL